MCDLPTSQYGDNLRQMSEKLEIANYYRLKLWVKSGHYLDGKNCPNCYRRIQNAWMEAYDADPESTTTWGGARPAAHQGCGRGIRAVHGGRRGAAPCRR